MSKLRKSATEKTDSEIVEGIAVGDSKTLDQLYRDYFPMVLHLVQHNSGSEDEARDLFQEAVMVLYDKIKRGDFELSSKLKTYIYSVCRRLWLKQLGHPDRTFHDVAHYAEIIPVEDDLARHREKDRQLVAMAEALDKLGEPCRTIIQDFYVSGLSMQEICLKFGYTNADNAKTQKYKCLQRLKKLFFTT